MVLNTTCARIKYIINKKKCFGDTKFNYFSCMLEIILEMKNFEIETKTALKQLERLTVSLRAISLN